MNLHEFGVQAKDRKLATSSLTGFHEVCWFAQLVCSRQELRVKNTGRTFPFSLWLLMLAAVDNEQLRDSLGSLKASQEVIWEVMEPWAQQPQESSGLQRCREPL